MRVAVIGRGEILLDSAEHLARRGYDIALVVTAKEAPEYERTAEHFRVFADCHGAPYIRTAKLNDQVERISSFAPIDVAVSVNYPGIISQRVVDLFRFGCLNAHAGDLPRFRGNATLAWAIVTGEPRVGLCVHRMVGSELDAGDILARSYHDVNLRTKIGELWDWVRQQAPLLFEKALQELERDSTFYLERQSNDPAAALRCYPRKPEDGRIRWERGAEDIIRLINASGRPYSGAFFYWKGERIVTIDAEIVSERESFLAVPGQVTAIGDGWVQVGAGDGRKIQINLIRQGDAELRPNQLVQSIRERFD